MRNIILLFCLALIGCSTNADGPRFDEYSTRSPIGNETKIYIFRDNLFYYNEASYLEGCLK